LSKAEIICEAIATRSRLQICYHDHYRVVEPNEYGSDHRGNPVLLAYQVEGGGGRDSRAGWRVLDLASMVRLTLLPDHFNGPMPRSKDEESRIARFGLTVVATLLN
jgi:hypothetical protein